MVSILSAGGRFIRAQRQEKKRRQRGLAHIVKGPPPKRTIELDDAKKIKSLRDLIFLAQFKFWDAKWQVKASAYEKKVVKNKVCLKR